MKPVTETLARFVTGTSYQDLPLPVVAAARSCILDWLGSAYAGSQETPTKILLEIVEELGGSPEATLIPTVKRTSCLNAALVNAASTHAVEMDDLARASIYHPAAPIIPAALAAAERSHADGQEFICAVVLGYEASMRIGEAISPSHYHYWHTTGTVGAFGAAVAAGVILKLDAERMVWALGSAG
ncbi:MAG: MmgE/PrpD family protein, partial [Dehalococcoidia bacterium]|nr:MmgE/PrpD family protein [Dehalococcoidia bacterium]